MRYLSDRQYEELLDRVREIKEDLDYIDDNERLLELVEGLEKEVENMDQANTWNGSRLVQM